MKSHRHLKNSKLLRFAAVAVLALCLIPMLPALATPHGAGCLLCAGMVGMVPLRLMDKDKDPGEGGGSGGGEKQPTRAEALAALADPTLTLGAKIKMCAKILSGEDPQNQLADAQSKLKTAEATLATRDTELKEAKADLEKAQKQITALQSDLTAADEARVAAEKKNVELSSKEQSIEERAKQKTREKVGSLGFNSTDLPPASDKPSAEASQDDVRAQFKAETDPIKKGRLNAKLREMEKKALAGVN